MCAGVDLNRNFDYAWGEGAFFDPKTGSGLRCLETYQGSKPFSEPESRTVRDFLYTIKDQLVVSDQSKKSLQKQNKIMVSFVISRCTFRCTVTDKKCSTLGVTGLTKLKTGKTWIF